MNKLNKFASQFTGKEYGEATAIGKKYFEAKNELLELNNRTQLKPHTIGVFLGEETRKGFRPSSYLLDRLSADSTRKVFVNRKAEWLFLCGRDVLGKSITRDEASEGLCLVCNEEGECLGFGEKKFVGNSVTIKNVFDKGDFLRREK